ncbi:hypothetical protein CYMTET_35743 [Cymbomonas tetramitiformis]|uniref:Uncharacterized protein n=1 Tax=Cymbomonas tetramitiformis TaxID=36881 RepID=A0AAE0F8Q2_9CHLO|nr:hypothetical protein CYMTET_35743 [Cymbomonas tetramitiformis]|eukprot:gene173-307_t
MIPNPSSSDLEIALAEARDGSSAAGSDLPTRAYVDLADVDDLVAALRRFFTARISEKQLCSLAPRHIRIRDSSVLYERHPTPLYVAHACSVWRYQPRCITDAACRCDADDIVLKVIVLRQRSIREIECTSDSARASTLRRIFADIGRVKAPHEVVVAHSTLQESGDDASSCRPLLFEMRATNSVDSTHHRITWGAQVMLKATVTAAQFMRSDGVLEAPVALAELATRALGCIMHLKRRNNRYHVDFKWENCGLFHDVDATIVKLLDTGGIVSARSSRERKSTYEARFDRVSDEKRVLWCVGVALLQAANPARYDLISSEFSRKGGLMRQMQVTEMCVHNVVRPLDRPHACAFYRLALRCMRFSSGKAIRLTSVHRELYRLMTTSPPDVSSVGLHDATCRIVEAGKAFGGVEDR